MPASWLLFREYGKVMRHQHSQKRKHIWAFGTSPNCGLRFCRTAGRTGTVQPSYSATHLGSTPQTTYLGPLPA